MRKLLAALLVVGVGVGVFVSRRGSASNEIKSQMLLILDDMDFTPRGRDEVKRLVLQFHDRVFSQALDMSRELGRKFDERSYYDELFRLVVFQLHEEGSASLAKKVEGLQKLHSLTVSEH